MTNYREIIRLNSLNFSQRNIALSCGASRNTVSRVLKRAQELDLAWPLDEQMTNADLERVLYPKEEKNLSTKRMPDYKYIRKELLKNGVSKKLLWTEYMELATKSAEKTATQIHKSRPPKYTIFGHGNA